MKTLPGPPPQAKRRGAYRLRAGLFLGAILVLGSVLPGLSGACENPPVLRFSIIPTEDTIQELGLYKPVPDYLSTVTGKKVEFYMPTSYASVVEALVGKWVDVAVLGPNSYLIAREKDPTIQVFATYAKEKGHLQEEGPGYRSVLITKKGSKFTTIEALKGSVLALTDPASTSGTLIPNVLFTKVIQMPLDRYFKKVVFSGEHDLSTLAVYDGKVDAAFVATHRLDDVVNLGKVKVEDFNILWRSPVVPQDPFVYRGALCPELKQKVEETFMSVGSQPSAKKFLANVHSAKFVKMTDADYDIVRELRKAAQK